MLGLLGAWWSVLACVGLKLLAVSVEGTLVVERKEGSHLGHRRGGDKSVHG